MLLAHAASREPTAVGGLHAGRRETALPGAGRGEPATPARQDFGPAEAAAGTGLNGRRRCLVDRTRARARVQRLVDERGGAAAPPGCDTARRRNALCASERVAATYLAARGPAARDALNLFRGDRFIVGKRC